MRVSQFFFCLWRPSGGRARLRHATRVLRYALQTPDHYVLIIHALDHTVCCIFQWYIYVWRSFYVCTCPKTCPSHLGESVVLHRIASKRRKQPPRDPNRPSRWWACCRRATTSGASGVSACSYCCTPPWCRWPRTRTTFPCERGRANKAQLDTAAATSTAACKPQVSSYNMHRWFHVVAKRHDQHGGDTAELVSIM